MLEVVGESSHRFQGGQEMRLKSDTGIFTMEIGQQTVILLKSMEIIMTTFLKK